MLDLHFSFRPLVILLFESNVMFCLSFVGLLYLAVYVLLHIGF